MTALPGQTRRRRSLPSADAWTRTSAAFARRLTSPGARTSSKSGYKFDDFKPYLYKTEDFGATWTSIAGNLPNEPINVVFEDAKNPDLLFVGNDTGVFVSIDRGARWVKMNNNMPNVAVHDLLVHPSENDLILGRTGAISGSPTSVRCRS